MSTPTQPAADGPGMILLILLRAILLSSASITLEIDVPHLGELYHSYRQTA